ncbi:uncharacterized protein LOC113295410 [Papaver somniferum]|uniref:uncharacterized protein LOC113295410 n=1 Tax=Papaver somniferum TaxID=3469 RepID=UPI000E6FFA0B|nr:uncharacterized protein LOC113295410 [Papaver somniferum]
MKSLKAPGPDGMPTLFYKRCWETVGEEVTQTIQNVFTSATLPMELNHTNIVLIPKVKHPTIPSEYRLLALTDIIYKVITKILAQRLKGHLDKLVDKNELLLFGTLDNQTIHTLLQILHIYAVWSGKTTNMQKSAVYFNKGVQRHRRIEVATLLGVKQMEYTDKYLGHHLLKPNHLNSSFDSLEDKFVTKTAGWKRIHLPDACRTMLIKTELGLIPPFNMATSLLPRKTLAHLIRIVRNFWWGHDKEVQKMHFIRWNQFELEKEQGGLGIRPLKNLNNAMIAKLVWKFLDDEYCIWGKIMKAKYVKNGNFWEIKKPTSCSATWNAMLSVREDMRDGCC